MVNQVRSLRTNSIEAVVLPRKRRELLAKRDRTCKRCERSRLSRPAVVSLHDAIFSHNWYVRTPVVVVYVIANGSPFLPRKLDPGYEAMAPYAFISWM